MTLMNLFSSFDPKSGNFFYIHTVFMIIVCMAQFKSKFYIMFKSVWKFVKMEIIPNLMIKEQTSMTNKIISLFLFLCFVNLGGLIPSSFSLTSQMCFNLVLSMTFWLPSILFPLKNKTVLFFSHLVPLSTPMPLTPLMVLIELVSLMIRPITLSVRLLANMVAGHILISLMESFVMYLPSNIIPNFLVSSILMLLETGVAIIQAYVFVILITLYVSENHL